MTLVRGDFRGIVRARRLSSATMRNIRQNLFFASLYSVAGVPIAAGILYPWFGLLLSPMIASAAMTFSSVGDWKRRGTSRNPRPVSRLCYGCGSGGRTCGHTMPTTKPSVTPPPAKAPAGAGDPHATHAKPSRAPAVKGTTAKPVPSKPSTPAAASPLRAEQGDKHMDPANGLMVDPATAPATAYQGQTYYFSSEPSRKEFLQNPAKFAKKPKK